MTTNEEIAAGMAERYRVDFAKGVSSGLDRAVTYTPEQIREKVGDRFSVRINFVPQMLTALAMDLASEFVNHCRDFRLEAAKKPNRLMRKAIETYADRLFRYYGREAATSYAEYVKRFMGEIRTDVWLLRLKLSELVANQLPGCKDREPAILTCAICGVVSYIEWYDAQMDKALAVRLGKSVKCRSNGCLDVVKALCVSIADDLGCRLRIDSAVSDWLNVLGNRAVLLAERIFDEECGDGNVSKC